jgi:hypothetical protein
VTRLRALLNDLVQYLRTPGRFSPRVNLRDLTRVIALTVPDPTPWLEEHAAWSLKKHWWWP